MHSVQVLYCRPTMQLCSLCGYLLHFICRNLSPPVTVYSISNFLHSILAKHCCDFVTTDVLKHGSLDHFRSSVMFVCVQELEAGDSFNSCTADIHGVCAVF